MGFLTILLCACLFETIAAQFPPNPEGLTTIISKIQPGVSISYKEVSRTCQQPSLVATN